MNLETTHWPVVILTSRQIIYAFYVAWVKSKVQTQTAEAQTPQKYGAVWELYFWNLNAANGTDLQDVWFRNMASMERLIENVSLHHSLLDFSD